MLKSIDTANTDVRFGKLLLFSDYNFTDLLEGDLQNQDPIAPNDENHKAAEPLAPAQDSEQMDGSHLHLKLRIPKLEPPREPDISKVKPREMNFQESKGGRIRLANW